MTEKHDNYHARLSPSRAHRYMPCSGSVVLEEGVADTSSFFADEGTAAHTLGEMCLRGTVDPDDFLGEHIAVKDAKFEVTKEMCAAVQVYVDYVRERAQGKVLLLEQDVPIGHLTGEKGATGRVDALIIDTAAREIEVIDYKHGAGVPVSPVENEQGAKYGLGAIFEHGVVIEFETVHITIVQPRCGDGNPSRWTVPQGWLEGFAADVKKAAIAVGMAVEHFPGHDAPEDKLKVWAQQFLLPGEKQCRFCKARGPRCIAMTNAVVEVTSGEAATAADFAQFVPDVIEKDTVGPNYLATAMAKVGLVEDWCKAVRAEAERLLFAGKDVPGWKLVEGKLGNRAWASETAAEAKLKAQRLKQDEMYEKKLISPTTAEKLLKKTQPAKWAALQSLISRAPGKPSVAPASDPRPALSVVATGEDFAQFVNAD